MNVCKRVPEPDLGLPALMNGGVNISQDEGCNSTYVRLLVLSQHSPVL